MKPNDDELKSSIEEQSERRKRYEKRPSFWGQTIFTGTLGTIFILPVIAGAYLGRWLDTKLSGYSISWTINLILIGIFIGAFNSYLFIRDKK
jgi:ATP synthase protein I